MHLVSFLGATLGGKWGRGTEVCRVFKGSDLPTFLRSDREKGE